MWGFSYLTNVLLSATLRLQPHTRHARVQSTGQIPSQEQSRLLIQPWKRRRERVRHLRAFLIDDCLQSAPRQLPKTPHSLQTTLTRSIVNQIERIPHRRPALNRSPPQTDAAVPIQHLLRFRLARQSPILQEQMRQLMHQIVTLIPDQRIRLAQKDIVLHHRTVDILRPTGREDRLEWQRCEAGTDEHKDRILGPETRRFGPLTTDEGVVSDAVLLLHVRRRADEGGLLSPSCGFGAG